MKLSELISPPQFRNKNDNSNKERKSTWTELLYDLAFVVSLNILSQSLEGNLTVSNIFKFIILFLPLWWAWSGYTTYTDRFDNDDIIHKLFTLFQFFAITGLAVFSRLDFSEYFTGFSISYIFARIILILSYIRTYLNIPEAKDLAVRYAFGFSFALIPWLIGVFAPEYLKIPLVVIALIIDIGTPISQLKLQKKLPLNISHLPERFGLFILLVLGEVILGVINASQKITVGYKEIFIILSSTFIVFTIWWLYFENISGEILKKIRLSSQIWFYIHLPLTISIALIGVGLSSLLIHLSEESHLNISTSVLFLSFGICLLSLNIIEFLKTNIKINQNSRYDLIIRSIIAFISIILVFSNFNTYAGIVIVGIMSFIVLFTDIFTDILF